MMEKLSQKCHLTKVTLLWVALTHLQITIPPLPTVASLKDCLVHVEGVLGHDVQFLETRMERLP